jgi:hypothetical protein
MRLGGNRRSDTMPNVSELRDLVAERRRLLAEAEAALAAALTREPAVGDFARSTLTHFYGRVTKVTARRSGRPFIEITPYLTPTMPGRGTLDLYDAWELIDDPSRDVVAAPAEATGAEIATRLAEVIVSFGPLRTPQATRQA